MNRFLRAVFMVLLVYPVIFIWLGITLRHKERLPVKGPAIIIANHNSHLDTLTLLTLLPFRTMLQTLPAAAADYFHRNKWMTWFSDRVIGIIPVNRRQEGQGNPLQGCIDALVDNKIIILFPEGSRGEPDKLSQFKSGLWHLAKEFPEVPIIPIYLHGLGRAMGKGQHLLVPFFIHVYVGRSCFFNDDKEIFITQLQERFQCMKSRYVTGSEHSEQPPSN